MRKMDDPGATAVGIILKPIVEVIYSLLKRQCNYLCCLHNNNQTLHEEVTKLEVAKADLQRKVDDARLNGLEIPKNVQKWLEDASMNQATMVEIEDDIRNFQSCCLNIILRYSVSKRANKAAEAMVKLCDQRNNFGDDIFPPLPPAARVPFPLEGIITLQSRKQIEEMIVKALGRPDVNIVGIGGTGGVGKTSLAEKIIHRMMINKQVDEAVKVVISQKVNVMEIQQKIADLVGLKLDSEKESTARAHQLRARLKSTGKRIIVLDDVWEQLKYAEIGIPYGSDSGGGCKILLTSRDKQVLNRMGVLNQNCFAMDTLNEEDAWSLFKDKAGTCVENSNLKPTAKQVLNECKGLPLAIVIVGGALKDTDQIEIWDYALDQLRKAAPTNIEGVLTQVYKPLRLSYEYLTSEDAKSLFLLCCIFPEDFEIPLEDLVLYGMGLNIERVDNLSKARNRVFTIVKKLKSCSLLLDGKDEKHVKMHDVVRDVARFIATEQKLIDEQSDGDCKWAFIQKFAEDSDYMIGSDFQQLHILIIRHFNWGRYVSIDGFPCVGGMTDLKVLSLQQSSFKSPPRWKGLLENLKTLELKDCMLKNLSFIGELMGLEILKCIWCRNIEELPIEIGNLKRLKLLNLTGCGKLKRIRAGVISKLIELEELKILGSFKEWESTKIVNEELDKNASLKELESLKKLTWLEIEIADIELVKEKVSLPESIVKYDIQVGSYEFSHKAKPVSSYPCLLTKHNHYFQSWINKFVSGAEVSCLDGNWSRRFIQSDCFGSIVKILQIENAEELVSLMNTSTISIDLREWGVFSILECMKLKNLPHLTHICDGPIQKGSTSFQNLRELSLENLPSLTQVLQGPNQNVSFNNLSETRIHRCNELHNLLLLKKIEDVVRKLKKLVISECKKMEEVFFIERTEQVEKNSKLAFPNMVNMEIRKMPNLTAFGKGIESIEFPSLVKLCLEDCPKLKWMDSEDGFTDDEYSLHYFCDKKVTFGMLKILTVGEYNIARSLWCGQISPQFFEKLEELTVHGCQNIKILCSFSVAKNLIHLKSLEIKWCDEMEHLIGVEKEIIHQSCSTSSEILEGYSINEENEEGGRIPFPKLEKLELFSLKKFKTLCEGIKTFQLPMLHSLSILDGLKVIKSNENKTDRSDCDNDSLHFFCGEQLPSSGLKKLNIYDYDVSNLWCQQIPPCFFHTLEELEIWYCSLLSAFPYSVAKHLLNLKLLTIVSCKEMEKVVSGVEKETHEQNSILLFPSLVELNLLHVPSLEMFCERECCLTLPSLEFMNVDFVYIRKSTDTDEGIEDWNNLLCQHILMSKKEVEERQQQQQQQQELGEIQEAPEISGEKTKDEVHVEAGPSVSGQDFGTLNSPNNHPKPIVDQAESSTATKDKMSAEITIEQQGAQHDA